MSKDNKASAIRQDAKGQFAPSQADGNSDGVASAKPTVVTGSEDATAHKFPPGKTPVEDWDPNYQPRKAQKTDPQ